jgi:hypothetical protein
MDETSQPRPANRRKRLLTALSLAAVFVAGTVIFTIRSYWRSDSLTIADATICTDEGLFSLQIPLVRLAREEQATTTWVTYTRGANMWQYGDGGKAKLRKWISMKDQVRIEAEMVADFGYWKGSWQSNSRPGPFIVMFVPIWAAMAAIVLLAAAFVMRRMKFRISSLLVATSVVGGLLWLLTLRAAE